MKECDVELYNDDFGQYDDGMVGLSETINILMLTLRLHHQMLEATSANTRHIQWTKPLNQNTAANNRNRQLPQQKNTILYKMNTEATLPSDVV